ncbi:type IA DNA topoisomerase [Rummeliibacillus sp. TYF005]|uniref:type IA DNA topoisomerase n=1 Tax=Rummeliibacillus sp. TYF005 TaxID=2058214 RepID=UPI000F536977|nr:type IA DNA topoisomerase [Rummeliibacillus sp. TYF005]RPJ95305.1 type IA DNA topoisomerase [Rummeliibacillus sp. TYF005]
MTKICILAEKPSQAKAYADAFKVAKKTKNYIELQPSAIFPQGATITWGIGHLVELKQPADYKPEWKRWSLNQLPMIPEKYEFRVAKGKWDQFQEVKRLFKEADLLINACDVDREGSNIFYSILRQTGVRNKPIQRLWINSLEIEEIRKGFTNLRDNQKDLLLYREAQTRQISDWLVGMNASRLYTMLLKAKGLNETMSIGRVQSPTVYMIYKRHMEIENFKPTNFYELTGDFLAEKGPYKGKASVKKDKREEAEAILMQAGIEEDEPLPGTIKDVKKARKAIKPPKLHSLSTLQAKANKIWKYSPAKVLEIVQSLYEKKLVSYPRSDCQFITDAEFGYLVERIPAYQKIIGQPFEVANARPQKRYVDSSKVEEHYAIIPTKTIPSEQKIAGLPPMERNIYIEIVRNTMAMFHRDYLYEETTILTDVKSIEFKTTGKVELDKGFQGLWPVATKKKEEPLLPLVQIQDIVESHIHIHEGTTQPPKPYTEGQLVQMMKTCGKLIEDEGESDILKEVEGLGTEATRSGIIETIKRHGYIEVVKNIVNITDKGRVLCETIEGSLLSSPSMTAKWETYLRKIGNGNGSQEAFLGSVSKFLHHLIQVTPEKVAGTNIQAAIESAPSNEPIVECPICHQGKIVARKSFYGCSNYRAGCKFTVSKTIASKKLSPNQVKDLCQNGVTKEMKGFKSKKGTSFSAKLKLDQGKVVFDFN